MLSIQDHRVIHHLNIPEECNGLKIDDYVEYTKDGETRRGYIYCFRRFGYSWFAWINYDKNIPKIAENVYVDNLIKIEE